MLVALASLGSGVVPTVVLPPSDRDPCTVIDQAPNRAPETGAPFTADDQLGLVDIGQQDPRGAKASFDLSPDGDRVAVMLKSADPESNAYCLRLIVTPMDGSASAVEIDRGGQFIRSDFALRDFTAIRAGYDRPNPPHWSPDGTRIAFLKRVNGMTQAWMVAADGKSAARQISRLADDADSLAWTADGKSLVVASRPGIRLKAKAIAREASEGFLFDDRFAPNLAGRPIPSGPVPTDYTVVPLSGAAARPAAADEIARLGPALPDAAPKGARLFVSGPQGHAAWVERSDPDYLLSPSHPVIAYPDGRKATCRSKACEGLRALWWDEDGKALLGFQWTGWANGQTALWRWDLDKPQSRQIVTTDDMLIGCMPAGDEVLCAREGATGPRQLVALDARSGEQRLIYDPNPQLRGRAFGQVTRLRYRDPNGIEGLADLVLPPDHRQGQKHPMVVVQYRSDGFLRGGTGDEVPIHVLANRGFAILSFARPYPPPPPVPPKTDDELVRAGRVDWKSRRTVQASLEEAVKLAIQSGAVDPARIGISGFSDGMSTVQWALINSDLFKVAAIGSCCEDLFAYAYSAGPRFGKLIRTPGYRFFETGSEEDWKPMSLILNVDKVRVPILAQVSDSEYESGLDVVTTYRLRRRPFELHVFENETHVKWQPAHRRAIYRRTVEWFEFWLRGRMDCDPARNDQYDRWFAMEGAPPADTIACYKKP